MSRQNVEIVRRPTEIEWVASPSGFWRGHEGVRRALAKWIGAWEDYRFEVGQLIDLGDDVLVEGWQHGRGKTSGIEVSEEIFSVWTLRTGRVVRQRMFRDRLQAFEAVGLRE